MSENVQKLIGVAVMAVLVVVGIAVSSGDDTDFTRNVSFRSAPSPSASADKAADCCDQTLALLGSMQTQLTDNSSQLADNSSQLADNSSQLADNSSQLAISSSQLAINSSKLQILLDAESEASTSGASPDLQQIADQLAQACPNSDSSNWDSIYKPTQGAVCVLEYLVGFPLELARQVVLTHGKYGFFHRFNADLAFQLPMTHEKIYSNAKAAVTEEACQQIFYGYNPPPRFAVLVDTKDGLVLPNSNEFFYTHEANGMIQYLKDTVLINNATASDNYSWHHHWPTQVATHGLCE